MEYIKDGIVYNISSIRYLHPNMSIPDGASLEDIGYYKIEQTSPPVVGENEVPVRDIPEEYEPGRWRYTWRTEIVPVSIPQSVSRLQAITALHNAGLLSQINTLINEPSTDPVVVIAWENAQTFERTSPTIASLAASLNLTSEQVDSLFISASQITA